MKVAISDKIVVPLHGVGTVVRIERSDVAGDVVAHIKTATHTDIKPIGKLERDGYRHLVSRDVLIQAFAVLCKARQKIPGRVWSQQKAYLEKKQSGTNIVAIAECIRDLYLHDGEERSYARTLLYEQMLARLAEEAALVLELPLQGMRGLIESTIVNRKIPDTLK